MTGYCVQNGCHNCKHVFVKQEHDEEAYLFCNFNAPPRPKCGSVLMDECLSDFPVPVRRELYAAWDAWARPRAVRSAGTCNNWEEQ